MHKLFDKILVNRVREVFNDHQEVYNHGDWNKLRAKMGQKKKGMVIWVPHVAKAASIILFLGFSVFVANEIGMDKMSQKYGKAPESNNINLDRQEMNSASNTVDKIENSTESVDSQYFKKNQVADNERDILSVKGANKDYIIVFADSLETNNDSENRFANLKYELDKHYQEIQNMDSSQKRSNIPILTEDNSEFTFIENSTNEKGRFGFGVELASVSNYSTEGNTNGVNVGGGFSAAYQISKKISLATGALIAKQSVNYMGSGENDRPYVGENFAAADNTLAMIDMKTAESEVSFVAIDIPMNVQYKHKRISITTGLSSLLYVQEKFSYSYDATITKTVYNYQTYRYDTHKSVETVNKEETSESFNRFDFARLLNLSIGYDILLAKGNLMVEPYIKYPLGSISSKEILMGSGGFALRYNF